MRSTKIVATLGPATDGLLEPLVAAGVDVFRLNFSHGHPAQHAKRLNEVRRAAESQKRYVAVLADLQGPKIRICAFTPGSVELCEGDVFCIDAELGDSEGTRDSVGTTYLSLANELHTGDILVLGDGLIELEVTGTSDTIVNTRVIAGGTLDSNKGINKRGGGLSAPALTEKDKADLVFACELEVDYIAVSFPRSASDMEEARQLIAQCGGKAALVAKIERAEAIADDETLDQLILSSDAIMVARGDLGIEIGDAALMGVQKKLISRARALHRSVITATQMMESMIINASPTRAEVMDVANAVLDGTDAVMLSGETAVGKNPVTVVKAMVNVIEGAEASDHFHREPSAIVDSLTIDESIARAAMKVAEQLSGVRAVACLTASGKTPRLMSHNRSRLPIYAMANDPRTLARVALYRGVHPVHFDTGTLSYESVNDSALDWLKEHGAVQAGDRVILSKGDYENVQGGTNTLKVLEVT